MPQSIPLYRALLYTAIVALFFLGLGEYAARMEEKINYSVRPSILEYQQLPPAFFETQNLLGKGQAIRLIGVTHAYQTVPLAKADGEIRVGIIGGSAVAGIGYSPTWSFPGALQRIADAEGKNIRVINLGRIGYASRQLIPLTVAALRELRLDFLVIYAGNNEFLEANARLTMGEDLAAASRSDRGILRKSALYRLMSRSIFSVRKHKADTDRTRPVPAALPIEVFDDIRNDFSHNIGEMIRAAGEKTKMVVCTVPTNLEFGPTGHHPFFLNPEGPEKWEAVEATLAYRKMGRDELAEQAKQKALSLMDDQEAAGFLMMLGEDAWETAEKVLASYSATALPEMSDTAIWNVARAASLKNKPALIAPLRAFMLRKKLGSYEGQYWSAQFALLESQQHKIYLEQLSAARDADLRRIRIPSIFNNDLRKLATENGAMLIDLAPLFYDYRHFNDYCHLNIDGNFAVARELYFALFGEKPGDAEVRFPMTLDRDYLAPQQYVGFDNEPYRIYDQQPRAISAEPYFELPPKTLDEQMWLANREFFAWAGQNRAQFDKWIALFEKGLEGPDADQCKSALQYLRSAENIE